MDFSKTGKSANPWYCWWPEVELNHRHTDFQSVALPTELSGPLKRGLWSITWSSSTAARKESPGAVGESWTPTRFLSHDSESCMSTNSITTAYWYYWAFYNIIRNLIPNLVYFSRICDFTWGKFWWQLIYYFCWWFGDCNETFLAWKDLNLPNFWKIVLRVNF